MPYIPEEDRFRLDPLAVRDGGAHTGIASTPGELNFQITELCKGYMEVNGESYQRYNDCLGALEGAKLELYRRKVAKYEDKKIAANGDVYR